ncbi:MAG TPA: protein translocase subunit SecF [Dehalococcoidia bacterium]|nr:protein translocase subunit SecF [Dehalococcoidia bacterium]
MFDIVGKRTWFFAISLFLILVSAIALAVLGLNPGIDFSSGSITTLTFEETVTPQEVEDELTRLGYTAQVEESQGKIIIHTVELTTAERSAMEQGLVAAFGPVDEEAKGFENVSPVIAKETARIAGIAVGVAAVGILIYITWAFRRMPKPLRYGTCAVIALVHDVLVVLGIFTIFGSFMNWEVNLMFITGILAVIGYSVNNTVVVFDRIRENLRQGLSADFEVVVNASLVETLGRSLNTSITTLAVVIALVLFVGVSIQNFAVVLLIGVIAGTYSSLFVAPQLLVVWEQGKWSGFIRRPSLTAGGARRG